MSMNYYVIPGLPVHLTRDLIFFIVCKYYNKEPKEVRENRKSRKRVYVEIRQVSMTIMKWKIENISWYQISEFFNQDHSTAIHAAKTILNLWDTDKYFRQKLSELFGGERPEIDFREYRGAELVGEKIK